MLGRAFLGVEVDRYLHIRCHFAACATLRQHVLERQIAHELRHDMHAQLCTGVRCGPVFRAARRRGAVFLVCHWKLLKARIKIGFA